MLTKYWRTERARRQLLRSILPRPGITPRAGETKEEGDPFSNLLNCNDPIWIAASVTNNYY